LSWIEYYLLPRGRRIRRISAALPGVNCGSCGFASCRDYAVDMVMTGNPPDLCPVCDRYMYDTLLEMMGKK